MNSKSEGTWTLSWRKRYYPQVCQEGLT